jgi:hypothetical protein
LVRCNEGLGGRPSSLRLARGDCAAPPAGGDKVRASRRPPMAPTKAKADHTMANAAARADAVGGAPGMENTVCRSIGVTVAAAARS